MRRFLRFLVMLLALSPLLAIAAEIVNINTADEASLQQVKGIGPSKARAIIDYRQKNGAFASTDDLIKVPGFGKKSLERIKPQITVDKAESPAKKKDSKESAEPKALKKP